MPASIDWRNKNGKNYLQVVKDQGGCGSCWAFSTSFVFESYRAIANGGGTVPNLPEQNLIDCTYSVGPDWQSNPHDGCDGGDQLDA